MIPGMLPTVAAGAIAGLGLALLTAEMRPAPVRLDAALGRLHGAARGQEGRRATQDTALGKWLAAHLAWSAGIVIPRADLALLGKTPEMFLVRKAVFALAGLVAFALAGLGLGVGGVSLPWEVPVVASLVVAAGMFMLPDADVRAEAARRRRDFRYAWVSYVLLVRLARTAGAGTTEALEYASRRGSGWVFLRIRAALDSARAAHVPLWQGLLDLGEEIGAAEVSELAETARVAGSEGTRIADTLGASAESLRRVMLTDSRARANARTTTMIVPLTLLGLGFVLLMGFPAFYALLFTPT